MKILFLLLAFALSSSCTGYDDKGDSFPPEISQPDDSEDADNDEDADNSENADNQEYMNKMIKISVGGKEFSATLADTAAAREFASRLPLTLTMSELNGNEKYCYLDKSLPTAASSVANIAAGDIMLWQNNCIVLFYKSFQSGYSYTRIGRLDAPQGIAEAVGTGSATVSFTLTEQQ